ncbi:MAG: AAA family ATPase [Myxococcota bacterium]
MSAAGDPFPSTADPAAYVPRAATERALAALEEGYRAGQRLQVLSGPPGHGKTLLARVLAARLGEAFRSLYLPYVSLEPEELASWVLGLLGEDPGSGWRGLASLADASRDRPLLLLVDEANSMPEETAIRLDELLLGADGGLRLLLIPAELPEPSGDLKRLVSGSMELRLNAPLKAEEMRRYIDARLAHAQAPPTLREAFGGEMAERLLQASEGIPSEVHRFATEVLRGNEAGVPELRLEPEADVTAGPEDVFAAESGTPAVAAPVEMTPAPVEVAPPRESERNDAESPFSLPESPDPPGVAWIVLVNLGIAGAMFGLLWWLGYIPPH